LLSFIRKIKLKLIAKIDHNGKLVMSIKGFLEVFYEKALYIPSNNLLDSASYLDHGFFYYQTFE